MWKNSIDKAEGLLYLIGKVSKPKLNRGDKVKEVKYKRLRGRIIEKYGSISNMCRATGMSQSWVSLKISGKREIKISDIVRLCDALDIDFVNAGYFFVE